MFAAIEVISCDIDDIDGRRPCISEPRTYHRNEPSKAPRYPCCVIPQVLQCQYVRRAVLTSRASELFKAVQLCNRTVANHRLRAGSGLQS